MAPLSDHPGDGGDIMAKMMRLDPAPKVPLPGVDWELIATEAGRYATGSRTTIQSWNGTLQGARQLALTDPESSRDCAAELAAQTGVPVAEVTKILLTLAGTGERSVYVRLAEHAGAIYLDLANERWQAIKITEGGWGIVSDPPVKFLRARGMLALPTPVPGGSLDDLQPFINVGIACEADWTLLMAWLVSTFRPHGPFPVLCLHGEQGSAKSTTARVLRALVDPNSAALRADPRDARDLIIAANNGWVVALVNLSRIPVWLSDAICRLATGGGFGARELYSDSDEILFEAQRPVILNGIEELATRGDLLDRSIIQHLASIAEEDRKAEGPFWEDFEAKRPQILFQPRAHGGTRPIRIEKRPT
jgi:hypothetical protein